jgi:hypothetical protein
LKYLLDGSWQLLVDGTSVASGNVVSGTGGVTIAGFKAAYDEWHNLALQVVDKKGLPTRICGLRDSDGMTAAAAAA